MTVVMASFQLLLIEAVLFPHFCVKQVERQTAPQPDVLPARCTAVRWTTNEHRSHFKLKYWSDLLILKIRRTKLPVSTVRPLLQLVLWKNPTIGSRILCLIKHFGPEYQREEEESSPTGMWTNTARYEVIIRVSFQNWWWSRAIPPFL